jgi:hypothetical protein
MRQLCHIRSNVAAGINAEVDPRNHGMVDGLVNCQWGFEVWENFIVLSYEGQGVNLYRALPSRG